jgi:hypothetical protein
MFGHASTDDLGNYCIAFNALCSAPGVKHDYISPARMHVSVQCSKTLLRPYQWTEAGCAHFMW